MKILKIKIIAGIPCITLDDGIICTEDQLEEESKRLIMPDYFTEVQHTKENNYFKKVLEELKKKFGEE